jgi:hypothetical protein
MNKIEQLLQLINTMSGAEKRHFKLQCNLQKGEKEYLYLYEKLENCDSIESICKSFSRKFGKKQLEPATVYLYDQLLNNLVNLNSNNNMQDYIFRHISQATFLYERRFVKEALQKLSKAKQLAQNFEHDILLLLIWRIEIMYITENNFMDLTEQQLLSKQIKLNECLKYTQSTNMHISLFSTLNYRLYHLGKARSVKQKELMNDLVLSELNLLSNNYYQGFESMKLHLLFQASYYLNTGSYKSAIRYYTELLELFDEYEHLKQHPPIYYLSTIEGIINSLFTAEIYRETPLFIERLRALEKTDFPIDFQMKVHWLLFYFQTEHFIRCGRFMEARQLCEVYEDNLINKAKLLNPEYQLRLYISLAIIYLCNNDLVKAKKYMKRIIMEGKLFHTFPIYRTARILNLIISVESNEYDLLDNEIRSIKRAIHNEKHAYMTEQLILKFVILYPISKYGKKRNLLWEKTEKLIVQIRDNKYEQDILSVFDFLSWVESKLTLTPFQKIMISKNTNG